MKKLTALLLALMLPCLLTACTDGGNVSDRTDGMIAETTVAAERPDATKRDDTRTEPSDGSDSFSESGDMTGASEGLTGVSEGLAGASEGLPGGKTDIPTEATSGAADNASGARTPTSAAPLAPPLGELSRQRRD